jgi:hypothetical protein
MEIEKAKDKWEEVCYLLSEKIKIDVREEFFEKEVLLVLEKLGWRQYKGEIAIKPSYSFGSQQTIIPDFVLYDHNKRPVVVVEVKRPSEDITSQQVIKQLTSYMRVPKVDFGLLIGNQIHFYYDGNLYPHDDPILLAKITSTRIPKMVSY